MEYRDWYFKTKRVWLCKHTPFMPEFMRHLYSKGLLDPDTQAVVESHPGPTKKCEVLYDHLVQFGPAKIVDIIQCLEESLMTHVADVFREYIPIHDARNGDCVAESAPLAQKSSSVWFEVGEVTHNFVGRQELNDIHKLLTSSTLIVYLVGPDGIGKSTLARKYAHVFREFCDGNVIWINAESKDSIRGSFVRLGQRLKLEVGPQTCDPEVTAKCFQFLKGRKCLFIFDGVQKFDIFNQFRPNGDGGNCRVLVTCKTSRPFAADDENMIRLGFLSVHVAVQLVQSQSPNASYEDASNLATTLNLCPLSLQQAVACILRRYAGHENPIQMYLTDFERSQKSLMIQSKEFMKTDFYAQIIWTTCAVTLDAIKQIPGCEAVSAIKLVQMLSYINNLTRKNLLEMFGDQLEPSLKLLAEFSLAQIYHARIEISRLVQDAIRAGLTAAEKESLMETYIC